VPAGIDATPFPALIFPTEINRASFVAAQFLALTDPRPYHRGTRARHLRMTKKLHKSANKTS
jgi:hypothetical protein